MAPIVMAEVWASDLDSGLGAPLALSALASLVGTLIITATPVTWGFLVYLLLLMLVL
jgi:hypothetical protein